MDRITDRHLWKHYVPATTVVGGNYCSSRRVQPELLRYLLSELFHCGQFQAVLRLNSLTIRMQLNIMEVGCGFHVQLKYIYVVYF